MLLHPRNPSASGSATPLSLRCPGCGQLATFEAIDQAKDVVDRSNSSMPWLGHRKCPNPDCNTHVFVVRKDRTVLASYPPQRISFDTENIPGQIAVSLEEAITCHAESCYTASAIMVRKTLEELCAHQNAQGPSLYDRIETLRDHVLLPPDLMSGLQDLRMLGNDAAHIESRIYDEIGEEEVVLAIDVTKEVLKGVYQVGNLVKRLRERKGANDE